MVIEIGVRPGDMFRGARRVDGVMRRGVYFIWLQGRVVLLTVSTSSSSHLIQYCTSGFVNVKGLA
jgi:hypothetical protein